MFGPWCLRLVVMSLMCSWASGGFQIELHFPMFLSAASLSLSIYIYIFLFFVSGRSLHSHLALCSCKLEAGEILFISAFKADSSWPEMSHVGHPMDQDCIHNTYCQHHQDLRCCVPIMYIYII